MLGYRVPRPDQAMLISGGKQKQEGTTFKVVIGHGAWVMQGFRKVGFLGLDLHTIDISESCRSTEGILLNLKAVVAFKVQSDVPSVNAAGQRFLGEQKRGQMEEMTNRIFAGHLRSIVGSMKVIDIHRNRDELAKNILEHSQFEMSKLGLTVDSFQIEHLDDGGAGYLDDLAAQEIAEKKRDADIARARTSQEISQAQQESERRQADAVRETQLKKAAIKAEVDRAQAEADVAGQLAKADAERQVIEREQLVAEQNALLREKELVVETIKPAEAAAKAVRINADAQTSAAEAAAKRAEYEAAAQATARVRHAEAEAAVQRAQAQANQETAAANAEAIRAKGEADAAAARAIGEAEAAVLKARGEAEGAGELAKAEALAANDRAQIEMARVQALPEMARALAEGVGNGLSGANVTLLDGGESLTKLFMGLTPMVEKIITSFKSQTSSSVEIPDSPANINNQGQPTANAHY